MSANATTDLSTPMHDSITVVIQEPPHSRFRELEYFVGHRLFRKGTDPRWFVDYSDRAEADLVVANLNAGGYHAHILGEPEKST